MLYINSHTIENVGDSSGSMVMLGNFDGMHMGHLALFDVLAYEAGKAGLAKVVFSFWPHPLDYLGAADFGLLLSSREKARILEELGADVFIEYPFDSELRNMTPETFIKTIIVGRLGAKAIVIGDDYAFGKNREGSPEHLRELGRENGFDVHVVEAVTHDGKRVSSRAIREYIAARDLTCAAEMMTRPYQISGVVQRGKQLGRELGFPTINITPPPEKLLPTFGVYITSATILDEGGQTYEGITNIGVNPTLSGADVSTKRCETYLYAFDEDVYDREVVINFYESLRGERRFKDVDALKRQVESDIETGRKLWAKLRLR